MKPPRVPLFLALCAVIFASPTGAQRAPSIPQHFIYFGRDRERLRDSAFLTNPAIAGAQVRYMWRELEPTRDRYALQPILDDIATLAAHGKRLFVQLQDVTFSETLPVPDYLRADPAFHGGAERKLEEDPQDASRDRFDGWVARRWDPAVRERFALLLDAIGRAVDTKIAGINLAESSIGFEQVRQHPPGFSYASYVEGITANMTAARRAFSRAAVILYANFMPGDSGTSPRFLREVYAHAAKIGVGVGGPDLRPLRPAQRANSLPLIANRPRGVLAGIAVQDDNLADVHPVTRQRTTVAALYRYATDTLHVDFLFWGTEEPYYSADILPFLGASARRP